METIDTAGTKNKRSPFVSWARPRTIRRSVLGRPFDLNGEANRVMKKQSSSAIIAANV